MQNNVIFVTYTMQLDCAAARRAQKIEDDINKESLIIIDVLYEKVEVATIEKLSNIQFGLLQSKLFIWLVIKFAHYSCRNQHCP